jgi:hypothetical protein
VVIQTTIEGRLDEEGESTMEYTEAYVDWRYSVEIAMQGAIARIHHKYRAHIPRPSAYGMIGERSVGGHVVDRRGQEFHSLLRGYLTERERCTVMSRPRILSISGGKFSFLFCLCRLKIHRDLELLSLFEILV